MKNGGLIALAAAGAAVAAFLVYRSRQSAPTGATSIVNVALDSPTHRGTDYVYASVAVHYNGPPVTLTLRIYYGDDVAQVVATLITTGVRDVLMTVPYNLNYKKPGAYPVKAVLYNANTGAILASKAGGTLVVTK